MSALARPSHLSPLTEVAFLGQRRRAVFMAVSAAGTHSSGNNKVKVESKAE